MTTRDRISKIVLLILVLLVSLLFLVMIRQYLMPLFMAGLFSALLTTPYRALCRRLGDREVLASILTIVGVIVLVLVPFAILVGIVAGQALHVSESVRPWIQTFIDEPSSISQYLEKVPFYEYLIPYRAVILEKVGMVVGGLSSFLLNSLQSVTMMTVNAMVGIVIMFYSMFFFLISGKQLLRKILYFLPLRDQDEQLLLHRFTSVTAATLKGTMIIGLIQGTICGTTFALAGIEGAVFWGAVMAVMSFIPAFGTTLVWGPAVIILLLKGEYMSAVILLAICGGVSGNIDNILRPRLVGKDTQMHDLYILFSTLGGISMFGILGIIIGPIIAALFITLWELYGQAFEKYLPAVGLFSSIHSSGPAKERPEDIHLFGDPDVRGELEENSGSEQNMTKKKTPGESQ